jgi:uncharacterized membrane protein
MTQAVYKVSLTLSILVVGLISGLFFGFASAVIPGLSRLTAGEYLAIMQSVNREIMNTWVLGVFLLPLILIPLNSYVAFQVTGPRSFVFSSIAAILYTVGVFGITAAGNFPLNNILEGLDLAGLDNHQLNALRFRLEKPWNTYHLMRTVFSFFSFSLLTLSFHPANTATWILTSTSPTVRR